MSEQEPHGLIQRAEWISGQNFDSSILDAIFGAAVKADTWAYDTEEYNHGYSWTVGQSEEKNGIGIYFSPAPGLLYITGSNLESQSVLQEETTRPHESTVAFSINRVVAETTDQHKRVTFTTLNTKNHGEELSIGSDGAITMLPPLNKPPISKDTAPNHTIAMNHNTPLEAENLDVPKDWLDEPHN